MATTTISDPDVRAKANAAAEALLLHRADVRLILRLLDNAETRKAHVYLGTVAEALDDTLEELGR